MPRAAALALAAALAACAGSSTSPPADGGPDAPDAPRSDAGFPVDAPASTVRFADPVCFPALPGVVRAVPTDLDRDGRADVVLEYAGPSGYGYARNASTPGEVRFDARVDRVSSDATPLAASTATQAADLDGDGFAELIRGDRWWRNGQGASGALTEAAFSGAGQVFLSGVGLVPPDPGSLAVVDLDRDDHVDLASLQSGNACSILVHPQQVGAAPAFGMQQILRVYVRGLTRCTSLAVGDLDGDGRADLVATSENPDRGSGEQGFAVLRNNTTPGRLMEGTFGAAVRFTTGAPGERRVTRNARLADFDGDGRLDLFYALSAPDAAGLSGAIRLNTRAADITAESFGPAIDLPGSLGDGASVSVVELDGNGVPDLVSGVGDRVVTAQNLAARNTAPTTAGFATRAFTLALASRAPTFADVDGDGRADVLYVRDGGFCVLRNTTP